MTGTVARASACLLIFVASALPLAAGKAAAAEDEPYLVEYRAYSKALKAGDNAGAATHAHAAWQAAEDALGDHRLTAILAYNYGRLILFDDGEAASTPLRRARELNEAGIGDFSANEVRSALWRKDSPRPHDPGDGLCEPAAVIGARAATRNLGDPFEKRLQVDERHHRNAVLPAKAH